MSLHVCAVLCCAVLCCRSLIERCLVRASRDVEGALQQLFREMRCVCVCVFVCLCLCCVMWCGMVVCVCVCVCVCVLVRTLANSAPHHLLPYPPPLMQIHFQLWAGVRETAPDEDSQDTAHKLYHLMNHPTPFNAHCHVSCICGRHYKLRTLPKRCIYCWNITIITMTTLFMASLSRETFLANLLLYTFSAWLENGRDS